MSLREYARKRNFGATPEPADGTRASKARARQPIFVVQLHHARARHYDFRLEVDGALKSWAVPKGPSLRPGEKRLAVEVEDHPLAYATFAGDIPAGHYGAGHVDIFDHGTWTPEAEPLAALAKGHLDFELHGGRLRGRWTLVRTHLRGAKPQWLLLKRSDAEARDAEADDLLDPQPGQPAAPRARAPRKASASADQHAAPPRATRWRERALALDGARARPLAAGFKPQLCVLQAVPPSGEGWLHETKWDGYRLLADLDQGRARLRSRNDIDWTAKLPGIVAAIEALPVASARLDGELIAADAHGRSDFSALQRALEMRATATLRYVLFDLPALAGVDLTQTPLQQRKTLLQQLLDAGTGEVLLYSTHVVGHGTEAFEDARRQHLEGIVSKAVDAPYVGARAPTWVKVKLAQTDEFVVVGYTAPKGARHGFGALLLAAVEDGALHYVGRVGSGFDDAVLESLTRTLETLRTDQAAVQLPAHVPFRASAVRWVAPRLVAEVAFRGWAKEGLLRQASFLRLRADKTTEDLGMRNQSTARRARQRATGTGAEDSGENEARPRQRAAEAARKGDAVAITHPTRIVFPDTRYTKQDVADYYRAVAEWMLPELGGRPLSLLRCPEGAGATCFFQKHDAGRLGAHIGSIELAEKSGDREPYLYVEDVRGLLELVQMNTLEFHPWGARVDAPERPDRLVFDLDPAPGIDWKMLLAAAREVRDRLAEAGLESFARLSGGKGVHVVAPIRRGPDWDAVKTFCGAFAEAMAVQQPLRYLATASKAKREGRIFIDWLRNARGATSVASWSLRARQGAPVALPIRWDELGRMKSGAAFDLAAAQRRAKSLRKDPWDGFATLDQALPAFEPAHS